MRILFMILMGYLICACGNNRLTDREGLEEAFNNNADSSLSESARYYFENVKVEFGEPISFESTQNIAIPIILDQKYMEKGVPRNSYFNIAIIDSTNQVKKLLFKSSVVIENISTFEREVDFTQGYRYNDPNQAYPLGYKSLIFFDVWSYKKRKRGYRRLYVYNLATDSLEQLSPDYANVTKWTAFEGQPKILVDYQFDSNKNGEFDKKDDENMILVNLNDSLPSRELFNLQELKKIKVQVAKEN